MRLLERQKRAIVPELPMADQRYTLPWHHTLAAVGGPPWASPQSNTVWRALSSYTEKRLMTALFSCFVPIIC